MNSNEHPKAYGYTPSRTPSHAFGAMPRKPPVPEDLLQSGEVQIERKSFQVALKENAKGRFLRITEQGGNKFSTVIVPATGLKEFQAMLTDMVETHEKLPPNQPPPTPLP